MLMPMPADVPATVLHQRAHGAFHVVFGCSARGTVLRDLHQAAPLRILFPQPEPGEPPLAALLNCAGGLAGGDQLEQSIKLEAGATATLSTAAAEKVYRSLGPMTRVATDIVLGAGATFEWLPQETILFDGARLQRRFAVELGAGAALLATEILVFGRGARGEIWRQGLLRDGWSLTGPEGLLWIDRQVLSPEAMAAPFGGVGAEAMGMLIVAAPGAEAARDLLRSLPDVGMHITGAFTLPRPGLLLGRWMGRAAAVRRAVEQAIVALRTMQGLPPRLPRLWTS
jgi:urease accessory protein